MTSPALPPAAPTAPDSADVLRLLRDGWRRIAAGAAAGAAIGLTVPIVQPTSFTASAYLVVVPVGTGTSADAANFGKVFARVAGDPVVLARSPHLAAIGMTPEQAGKATVVAASPDAPVLEVQAKASTAFRSAEIANFVSKGIVAYAGDRSTDTGYLVRQFVVAAPPTAPASPRPTLDLVVGVGLGTAVGVVAALARRSRPAAAPGAPHRSPLDELEDSLRG